MEVGTRVEIRCSFCTTCGNTWCGWRSHCFPGAGGVHFAFPVLSRFLEERRRITLVDTRHYWTSGDHSRLFRTSCLGISLGTLVAIAPSVDGDSWRSTKSYVERCARTVLGSSCDVSHGDVFGREPREPGVLFFRSSRWQFWNSLGPLLDITPPVDGHSLRLAKGYLRKHARNVLGSFDGVHRGQYFQSWGREPQCYMFGDLAARAGDEEDLSLVV